MRTLMTAQRLNESFGRRGHTLMVRAGQITTRLEDYIKWAGTRFRIAGTPEGARAVLAECDALLEVMAAQPKGRYTDHRVDELRKQCAELCDRLREA